MSGSLLTSKLIATIKEISPPGKGKKHKIEMGYCPQPGPSKKYPLFANKEKATNTNRGKKSTTSKILKQENTVRN